MERRKKLKECRERGDLIEVYKILKGLTRINLDEFWKVREAEMAANGRKQRET